jgi:hypothetical protein
LQSCLRDRHEAFNHGRYRDRNRTGPQGPAGAATARGNL